MAPTAPTSPEPVASNHHSLTAPAHLPGDTLGHWFFNRDNERLTVAIAMNDTGGPFTGTSFSEDAGAAPIALDQFGYDDITHALRFHAVEKGQHIWYRLAVQDGILTGRFARTTADERPADSAAFQGRVSGWRDETFSADITPRTFDLNIDGVGRAMIRLDNAPQTGAFVGQLKIYATSAGAIDEELAEDVAIQSWDGNTLAFTRPASPLHQRFKGTTTGRKISGTLTDDAGGTARAWHGERAEVLSHGVGSRSRAAMQRWQARTRDRLRWLVMDGAPAPLTVDVTELGSTDPIPKVADLNNRDDSVDSWPQSYRRTEVSIDVTLPNPYGGDPLPRHIHGMLAVPTTPPPPGGYPVVLAVNGHWGSAAQLFDPQNYYYWYGDAYARRGYVVMGVDLGHRPLEDRASVYSDDANDDSGNGNGPHPAIKAAGLNSDWEEDGERTWDAMRALDYVLARPDVNPQRIVATGLSMGGEITDWIGAMDTRVMATVAAGNPVDLAFMAVHGNHPCWQWQRAHTTEYIDQADLHALVAPRTYIRLTGAVDPCYSQADPPFAMAKQAMRRAQPAFDTLGGTFIHYLHYDEHNYHVGERVWNATEAAGLTVPVVNAPASDHPYATSWQQDRATSRIGGSLFEFLP